jgi:hypothetical protein
MFTLTKTVKCYAYLHGDYRLMQPNGVENAQGDVVSNDDQIHAPIFRVLIGEFPSID